MLDLSLPPPLLIISAAEQKSKVIVFLREGNTDDLGETIKRVKDKGPDGEKNLVEALQTKSFEDDQNLLMQAATYGSKLGFLTFVHAILERVSAKC